MNPNVKNTKTAGLKASPAVSGGTRVPLLTLAGQQPYQNRKVNAARMEWLYIPSVFKPPNS